MEEDLGQAQQLLAEVDEGEEDEGAMRQQMLQLMQMKEMLMGR